jgi:integrase
MATIRKLRGRWQAQVRRRGMAPRAKSFDGRGDAERWARSLEAELDRCGHLPDTRAAERTTLGDILTRYAAEVSPTKRGAESEILRINAILRRAIVHSTLARLSSNELARYRNQRLQTVAPATVSRELNLISHAIDTARREWDVYLAQNPAKMVSRPKLPNGRTRRLNLGEEQRLLAAADRGRCRYMRPLITLALETGARRGELLGLRWADIDLDRRIAHLPLTKNGSARDIPLSSRATETLRALAARRDSDTDHVFPISGNAVRLAWERLRQRAGIVDLHFHDLRHEAVSRLFEKGLDMMAVAAISGHKTLSMLSRYTHLRAVDLVERLG